MCCRIVIECEGEEERDVTERTAGMEMCALKTTDGVDSCREHWDAS